MQSLMSRKKPKNRRFLSIVKAV